MLSKTLIVCLLALFCLTFATRELDLRIASDDISKQGQFPYIVSLQYSNGNTTFQSTGIIYGATSFITTANVFNNFPTGGATLTVGAGAFDLTQAAQVISFAATVGRYGFVANGTTPPPLPAAQILIPTNFVVGQSNYDLAVVRIPAPGFNLASTEIKVANFPTSSFVRDEPIYAVAYGNQGPGSPVFPKLKYASMELKRNSLCAAALSQNNVSRTLNTSQSFCIQSQTANNTNGTFNGVCGSDIGGAVVRDSDITNPNDYYEVVGLISYAGDTTTCNTATRVPAIISYLSYFYNPFISPIAGTLAQNNNGQNATANPNSNRGNAICGNGIVEGLEKCEGSTNLCCNPNTCGFRSNKNICARPRNGTINRCKTRGQCFDGVCVQRNRPNRKIPCGGKGKKGTKCIEGVCNKCTLGNCTPL